MRNIPMAAVLLLACGTTTRSTSVDRLPDAPASEPLKAPAQLLAVELENGLPYDGCTWVVTAGAERYAPDEASEAAIVAFTQNAIGKTNARAAFTLTGKVRSVRCGWSASQPLPEISIRTLAP